jgi:predicted phosphodiesterase
VYGHTHVPRLARVGRQWIVNPGSPTERRRAPARSMLELKVHGDDLRPRLVDLP